MEQWEVLAIDKTAVIKIKAENKEIKGARLLLKGDALVGDRERFLGFNWHDQFISNERLDKLGVLPQPGDIVEFHFNRYGDIEKIEVVS